MISADGTDDVDIRKFQASYRATLSSEVFGMTTIGVTASAGGRPAALICRQPETE